MNKKLNDISQKFTGNNIDPIKWENSIYKPTPTIIEAAQVLYQGHSVKEIENIFSVELGREDIRIKKKNFFNVLTH